MNFKLKFFGMDIVEFFSMKNPKPKAGYVYNNCVFERPFPIAITLPKEAENEGVKKGISDEDFNALTEILSKEYFVDQDIIKKILKNAGDWIGRL